MMKLTQAVAALSALYLASSPAYAAGLETQLRCSVPEDAAVFTRQPGAIPVVKSEKSAAEATRKDLPAFMVEGWSPVPGPISQLLNELAGEAGLRVTGAEGMGNVSWKIGSAPLFEVLDKLTAQVGASWSYSSGVISVFKPAPTVPVNLATSLNRDVTLALLDTLRGYDVSGVALSDTGISFSIAPASITRVTNGLAAVSEIFVFDVAFLQGKPSGGRYAWELLPGSAPDTASKWIILDEQAAASLVPFLESSGAVKQGGRQTVAGPAGWGLVVPEEQCGNGRTEIQLRPKRVGEGFSLQISGMGNPMNVPNVALGQTLLISSKSAAGWVNLVSIRPRVISVR